MRQKSVIAIEKNDVHLVIGNELATRHEKVWILSRQSDALNDMDGDNTTSTPPDDKYGTNEIPDGYQVSACGLTSSSASHVSGNNIDTLEYFIIEHVVKHHFNYISNQINTSANGHHGNARSFKPMQQHSSLLPVTSAAESAVHGTMKSAAQHKSRLDGAFHRLQREKWKARSKELAWNVACSALGMALSYGCVCMLQRQRVGGGSSN